MIVLFDLVVQFRVVGIFPFDRYKFLLQCFERYEECRNDENLENHTDKHTAYGTCTQRVVTVCTYA